MKAIVITTINSPSEAIKKFAEIPDFKLFVAGDNKTPKGWKCKNSNFLSIENQKKTYPMFSGLVQENHYARKNFSYLEAIKSGVEYIYETDDDNIPYSFFPNFMTSKEEIYEINSPLSFNAYSLFTKKNIWPRGIPLGWLGNKKRKISKKTVSPLIQQSLADLDPDVDAIYRLTIGQEVKFQKNKRYSFAKGTYGPFNSQNTFWHKDVFPLLYLPSTVSSRATDIWRGYIAQRILWELGSNLIYLSPSVYQKRNIHNFMKDFEQEVEVYLNSEKLIGILQGIKLKGTPSQMLASVYQKLVADNFFEKRELAVVNEWLKNFSA